MNVSREASAALAEELGRRAKPAEPGVCLAGVDAGFGPVPAAEAVARARVGSSMTSAATG